ncbi:MAG TPA: SGNH hydrolase domain-containing protein, partial [bacterium]
CEAAWRRGWDYVRNNPDVNVVVVAGRWARVAGTYPDRPEREVYVRPIDSKLRISTALSQQTFETSLSGFVRDLANLGKRVILIGTTPEFSVQPRRCLANFDSLPLRRWFALPCDADARVVADSTAFLTRSLRSIAQQNPRTCLVEPIPFLCDGVTCPVQKNGLTYFRDENHLSMTGARALLAQAQAQPLACLEEALRQR